MRAAWLIAALLLTGALALLHSYALDEFLYWRYPWFDVPMHFLGGLAVGTVLVGFLFRFRPWLYLVLFAGGMVAWEVFEYLFGIPRETNYVFDTALDFLMDTLGGLVAYGLARATLWKGKRI